MCKEEPQLERKPIVRKGRLSGAHRNRLRRLLNMLYTTRELADEIGISARLIRDVYIPLGCPHTRNRQNHIMINGMVFKDWYQQLYKKRSLALDEAFCLTCRGAVEIVDPIDNEDNGLSYVLSECPNCGRTLAKITDMERKRT